MRWRSILQEETRRKNKGEGLKENAQGTVDSGLEEGTDGKIPQTSKILNSVKP